MLYIRKSNLITATFYQKADSLRNEIAELKEHRLKLNAMSLQTQEAEECLKAKEAAILSTEAALKEETEKLEHRSIQLRQDRDSLESLQADLSKTEKDLEIKRKRQERENVELRNQVSEGVGLCGRCFPLTGRN